MMSGHCRECGETGSHVPGCWNGPDLGELAEQSPVGRLPKAPTLAAEVARLTKEKQEALELLDQFNGMATRYKECMEQLERSRQECEGLREEVALLQEALERQIERTISAQEYTDAETHSAMILLGESKALATGGRHDSAE